MFVEKDASQNDIYKTIPKRDLIPQKGKGRFVVKAPERDLAFSINNWHNFLPLLKISNVVGIDNIFRYAIEAKSNLLKNDNTDKDSKKLLSDLVWLKSVREDFREITKQSMERWKKNKDYGKISEHFLTSDLLAQMDIDFLQTFQDKVIIALNELNKNGNPELAKKLKLDSIKEEVKEILDYAVDLSTKNFTLKCKEFMEKNKNKYELSQDDNDTLQKLYKKSQERQKEFLRNGMLDEDDRLISAFMHLNISKNNLFRMIEKFINPNEVYDNFEFGIGRQHGNVPL